MKIIEEIGLSAALTQLAEECCELGKAALKLQRIVDKHNPTPVTREQAEEDLIEEAADVVNSLNVLQTEAGLAIYTADDLKRKRDRWEERIEQARLKENPNWLPFTYEKEVL